MSNTHKPIHLGIPRAIPHPPIENQHYRELLSSLHRRLLFLITGDVSTHLQQAPAFGQQLLELARQDAGHLIASAAALIFALRAHRTSLAIAGVFGAGKTLTSTYLLAWLSLTTIHTRIAVLFRENPAGEAIAQNVDHLYLTDTQKQLLIQPVARDHYYPGRFTIDISRPTSAAMPLLMLKLFCVLQVQHIRMCKALIQ
eukprot:Skav235927  [mRNA]  locus=scaffold4009:15707:16303:+ [translate_table: standard]